MFIDEARKKFKFPRIDGIFDVSNVAKYVYSMPKERYDYYTDAISLMPPFNPSWFEWRRPEFSNEDGNVIHGIPQDRNGFYIEIFKFDIKISILRITWVLEQHGFIAMPAIVEIMLDEYGKGFPIDGSKIGYQICNGLELNTIKEVFPHCVLIMTMNFLHCKNCHIVEQRIPISHNKSKRRRERGYTERYHVLQIETMKKVFAEEGNAEKTGIKQALHICRGHFKTYTAEKPLLGKISGTFWWADHIRGDPDTGVVEKDYSFRDVGTSKSGFCFKD
jgi:hypothetical protein